MAGGSTKKIKIHNKSDKPDNVVAREHEITEKCKRIEEELPRFLRGFFAYLKGNVLPMTRLAYLQDIRFFMQYLIRETALTEANETKEIKLTELAQVQAVDVNMFIDHCRQYTVETEQPHEIIPYDGAI